jgi:hypothetical protein
MFEQLKIVNPLSVERRDDPLARLDRVRVISVGYGVGDDMGFPPVEVHAEEPVSWDLAAGRGAGASEVIAAFVASLRLVSALRLQLFTFVRDNQFELPTLIGH